MFSSDLDLVLSFPIRDYHSGPGIIIPDPDPTLKKKKVGSLTFSLLKRGGDLTVTVKKF